MWRYVNKYKLYINKYSYPKQSLSLYLDLGILSQAKAKEKVPKFGLFNKIPNTLEFSQ